MPEWWLVALATFAAYRVTRIVTTDKIGEPFFEPIRLRLEARWIRKHAGDDENLAHLYGKSTEWNSKLAFLLSCVWCLGFWVSGVFTVILSVAYGLHYPILTWLAMSAVVGFLGRIDSE
jgi:hypothetical protein